MALPVAMVVLVPTVVASVVDFAFASSRLASTIALIKQFVALDISKSFF